MKVETLDLPSPLSEVIIKPLLSIKINPRSDYQQPLSYFATLAPVCTIVLVLTTHTVTVC